MRAKSREGCAFIGRQRTRPDGDAWHDPSQLPPLPSPTPWPSPALGTGYQLTDQERQNLVSSAVFIYFAKQLQAQRMMNQEGLPPVYHYAPEVCVTLDGEVKAVSVTINETDATSLLVRDGDERALWTGKKCEEMWRHSRRLMLSALTPCYAWSTISCAWMARRLRFPTRTGSRDLPSLRRRSTTKRSRCSTSNRRATFTP